MRVLPRSLYRCVFLLACFTSRFVLGTELPDLKAPLASPTELVHVALQAEINHDSAARTTSLARALAEAPHDPAAHWHSGQVRVGNDWLPVKEAEARAVVDPRLIEYRRLRDLDAGTVDGQIALARWCRKQNLDVQEQFHWAMVMQLSPQYKEAQSRLGLQEFRGHFLTRDQIDAYKKQLDNSEAAMKKWKPRAQQWRTALSSRDHTVRAAALTELGDLRDVEAVPALEHVLAPTNTEAELAVVGVLSRIDDQNATDFLIRHAVLAEESKVREAASMALKPRSLFAYVPTLLGSLKTPIEYSYFANTFRAEGPSQILEMRPDTYVRITMITSRRFRNSEDIYDPQSSPMAKVQKAQAVSRVNVESELRNERIYPALTITTGQQLPKEPQAWWQWWQQYNELQSSQDPTQKQVVRPQSTHRFQVRYVTLSCFLPGTKVWLDTGPVAIERVRSGDRVLSQDPDSGELGYRFVIDTTIRPPSPTLRIGLPKEEIAATLGHPIWVVGKGWRMAKEIAIGDHLHGIHGGVPVEYLEKGPESNAYNLVVAGFNTYCIGDHRILVHDNIGRRPSQALVPGFVPREVVASK